VTIRNTDIAIWAGTQFLGGSKGLTVKHCRFENVGLGVFANYSGSSDFYIADNTFIGRDDPNHLIGWSGNLWAQFAGVDSVTERQHAERRVGASANRKRRSVYRPAKHNATSGE
jgi:hypothetical protein